MLRAARTYLHWPVPRYVERNILYALGGLTLFSLVIQVFTGICMTFYYDPNFVDAYNSVDHITYRIPLGWLVRGIHHYNASAIIVLVALHTLRTFFYSAYKKPRELTWLTGVALLVIALGFGFTGYLLPWDQRGYWSTVVATEIAAKVPVMGDLTARLIKGGPELGQLTLTRFYITHIVVLPSLLVIFVLLHLQQHRFHGVAPSITKRGQAMANDKVPYWPNWAGMDLLLAMGLLAILIFLSWTSRVSLEFPADPTSTDYEPRPEWFFLSLYHMLRYVPGAWEPYLVVIVPTIVIGSMILLPFVDRGEERRPWRKKITTSIALIYITVIVVFTLLAL